MHEISTQLTALADFNNIRRIEGFERIKNEYLTHLTDESKLSPETCDYLFFPTDESELAAILKQMSDRKLNVALAERMHNLLDVEVKPMIKLSLKARVETIIDAYVRYCNLN